MFEFVVRPDRGRVSTQREEQSLSVMLRVQTPDCGPRVPLSLALLIDTSGSMSATLADGRSKIHKVIEALEQLAEHQGLADEDELLLVKFDSAAELLHQGRFAERKRLRPHLRRLADYRGLTHMAVGFDAALRALERAAHPARKILLFTDGRAQDESEVAGRIQNLLDERAIPTVGFGVGPDYNEQLLLQLADGSGGDYHHLDDLDQFGRCLEEHLIAAKREALREARLTFALPEQVQLRHLHRVGTLSGVIPPRDGGWPLGHLSAGQPSVFIARLRLPRRPPGRMRVLSARLDFTLEGESHRLTGDAIVEYTEDQDQIRCSIDPEVREYSAQSASQELIDAARRESDAGRTRELLRQARALTERLDNPALRTAIDRAMDDLTARRGIHPETLKQLASQQRHTARLSRFTPGATGPADADPRAAALDEARARRIREATGLGARRP
ncbi:MAG: VWA domain-containing protein [Candidatus Competibacteraceae bacterium]|nr:MAG: VWA domain-containing protein [Candidatus Competibacteraceae bacterium]